MAPDLFPNPNSPLFLSDDGVVLFYYIFARISGIFIISPLFSNRSVRVSTRVFLSVFTALLMTMTLQGQILNENSQYAKEIFSLAQSGWTFFFLKVVREVAIGYLLGFCFTLIFEALMLAGEVVDAMAGFATANMINPITNTSASLNTPIFILTGALIILSLDFHHAFIMIAAESFEVIPLGNYTMTGKTLWDLITGTSLIFVYAIKIATVPFAILSCGTIGIGFITRVVHEYNPLLTGLPMRFMLAFYTMMLGISFVSPVIQKAFLNFYELARQLIFDIAGR